MMAAGGRLSQRGRYRGARYHAALASWKASQRFREQGYPARAIAAARQALELWPKLAEPHVLLGDLHLAAGQREQAVQGYRRALEINPHLTWPRARLAALGREANGGARAPAHQPLTINH